MLPKNNRNIFPDVSNAKPPLNSIQQFRAAAAPSPSLSFNSNIVTQHRQSNSLQPNPGNKRFVAPPNSTLHLINSYQVNPNPPQMLRLPQHWSADTASLNNISQALYLIQQSQQLQTEKSQSSTSHLAEVYKNQTVHSASNNVTISSASQNQTATVVTMSTADIQLLEVLGRFISQQNNVQSGVALIKPESQLTQQLLSSRQRPSPHIASGVNPPAIMVHGHTPKFNHASQSQNNDGPRTSPASLSCNGGEVAKSGLTKMNLNSTAGIPVWTKLLDELSNNPEDLPAVKRLCQPKDSDDSQRKLSSQLRMRLNNDKGHLIQCSQQNLDTISSNNSFRTTSPMLTPSNNTDNHQILRQSKEISYLMSIQNEDKHLNKHFQKSLRDNTDLKRSSNACNPIIYGLPESTNGNTDNHKVKSCCSLIDFEQPINSKQTIKETAETLVENLLKHTQNHTNVVNSSNYDNNKVCQSCMSTTTDNVTMHSHNSPIVNSTLVSQEQTNNVLNFTNNRPNIPLRSILPPKKRIMLDFKENDEQYMEVSNSIVTKSACKMEIKMPVEDENVKIPRKRSYGDSLNGDNKIDISSYGTNFPIEKKRRGRIPGTGKKQKMKEESRQLDIAGLSMAGTEESWSELIKVVLRPSDMKRIFAKRFSALDLDSLKLSKEEFFQIGSCNELVSRIVKCRVCKHDTTSTTVDDTSSIKSGSRDSSTTTIVNSFCRFRGFRKLQFSAKGTLSQAGFGRSNDSDAQDLSLWQMHYPLTSNMSIPIATFLLEALSQIFCEVIDEENKLLQDPFQNNSDPVSVVAKNPQFNAFKGNHRPEINGLSWRRSMNSVREKCDVCDTLIFNIHWICRKCGYMICADCFRERNDIQLPSTLHQNLKVKDDNSYQNKTSNLIKSAVHLNTRGASKNRYFSFNRPWALCTANRQHHNPDQLLKVELVPIRVINELRNRMHTVAQLLQIKLKCNCLSGLKSNSQVILDQIIKGSVPVLDNDNVRSGNYDLHMLADIALKEVVSTDNRVETSIVERPSLTGVPRTASVLSPPHHTENRHCNNSRNNNHLKFSASWINVATNFKMIHLHRAQSTGNLKIFQQEWAKTNPVVVSGCLETIGCLCTPEKFMEDFELESSFLVDGDTGLPVPMATMKSFWEGFMSVDKRRTLTDCGSKSLCLKLKDWSPIDDFYEELPQRFKDIISNLPLKEYTSRQGEFNLASHLPSGFVLPELGPKIYNGYSVPRRVQSGSSNLHMAVSDSMHVMLYVGIPFDNIDAEMQDRRGSMTEANIDGSVMIRAEEELPGALWHIFLQKDVQKLREFLKDILIESGESPDADQDLIHDQRFYLNQSLLGRLKETKNVEGYAVVQFQGDALFLPAGSLYQVRNLHSCIRLANDFVSPDNIGNSLFVTRQVRQLGLTHHIHNEDLCQAKHMIFHAMKDAVSNLIIRNCGPVTQNLCNHTQESVVGPQCAAPLPLKEELKSNFEA